MPFPDDFLRKVAKNYSFRTLKILITAGPTQENWSYKVCLNNSSGKQGYALAEEFSKLGACNSDKWPTNINKPNKISLWSLICRRNATSGK